MTGGKNESERTRESQNEGGEDEIQRRVRPRRESGRARSEAVGLDERRADHRKKSGRDWPPSEEWQTGAEGSNERSDLAEDNRREDPTEKEKRSMDS